MAMFFLCKIFHSDCVIERWHFQEIECGKNQLKIRDPWPELKESLSRGRRLAIFQLVSAIVSARVIDVSFFCHFNWWYLKNYLEGIISSKCFEKEIKWVWKWTKRDIVEIPFVWMRLQLADISVVSVKYGIHKSSMYTSPNVSTIVSLNPLPVNIDVIGYVKSSNCLCHCVIFCQNKIDHSLEFREGFRTMFDLKHHKKSRIINLATKLPSTILLLSVSILLCSSRNSTERP